MSESEIDDVANLERRERVLRAQIADATGRNREARRAYAALKIELAIARSVASAPPLSDAQRADLRALLRGIR